MIIYKEINNLAQKLNRYQKEFVDITKELFTKIPQDNIGIKSNVKFDSVSNILEISLIHSKDPEMMILFILHEDMIEIGCVEYTYYMDSMKNALFAGLQGKEFYSNVKEFVTLILSSEFKLIVYSYKGKRIKSEIVWGDNEIPSQQHSYSMFNIFYKKAALDKQEVVFKSFMD